MYDGQDSDGRHCVIHMSGDDDKASATICRDFLRVFCGNNAYIAIVQHADARGEDHVRKAALNAARESLKSPPEAVYNLNENNSEHFATWCRTGKWVLNPDTDNILNLLYRKALGQTPDKFHMLFGKYPTYAYTHPPK